MADFTYTTYTFTHVYLMPLPLIYKAQASFVFSTIIVALHTNALLITFDNYYADYKRSDVLYSFTTISPARKSAGRGATIRH